MRLFSEEQRRGAVVLLPLLVVVVMLSVVAERQEWTKQSEDKAEAEEHSVAAEEHSVAAVELKPFDPNTFEYEELREAGLPSEVAAGVVRWRRYGKVYRIEEDLALVNGVTDSIYGVLKPYIIIADSLKPKPKYSDDSRWLAEEKESLSGGSDVENLKPRPLSRSLSKPLSLPEQPFRIDTASVEYLASVGFSQRQAEVVVKYRDAIGGIMSERQFRECYVVSDKLAERLLPYIIFAESESAETGALSEQNRQTESGEYVRGLPNGQRVVAQGGRVEINSADSATLIAIDGIGPKSVVDIINYRELLGGYRSVEQLAEIKTVAEQNYEKILQQISCDSCKIKKIDINFAGPKELERHPYVSARTLRRIIKQRQLKGGWSRIEEMTEQNILSEEEAKRLAPYLRFGLKAAE